MMKNLEVGQVIKNYNALCELLGVNPTKGKGREYHIKEFARYCTYHKEGQKFIVDEIYETAKEKVDGRSNNKFAEGTRHSQESYYKQYLKEIILDWFTNNPDEVMYTGSLYSLLYQEEVIEKEYFKEHKKLIGAYVESVGSKINKPFISALEELKQEGKIKYDRNILFKFEGKGNEWLLQDDQKELYDKAYEWAENETGLKPFSKYSYKLDCIQQFRAKVIEYMNTNGNYELELVSITRPYFIERGVLFTNHTMPVENKLALIENIHKQVVISKIVLEAKDKIKKFGQDKEEYFIEQVEKAKNKLFSISKLTDKQNEDKVKEEETTLVDSLAKEIDKEIKLITMISNSISTTELILLNNKYKKLTGKNNYHYLKYIYRDDLERAYNLYEYGNEYGLAYQEEDNIDAIVEEIVSPKHNFMRRVW